MEIRKTMGMALGLLALVGIGAPAAQAEDTAAKIRASDKSIAEQEVKRGVGERPAVQLPEGVTKPVPMQDPIRGGKKLDPALGAPTGDPTGRAEGPIRVPTRPAGSSSPAGADADDGCRDPQAAELRVSGMSRNDDGTWSFSLIGTVRNGGSAAFRSTPPQQDVVVLESGTQRGVGHFTNLSPGERINTPPIRISRWYTGNEFHPGFQLQINYDPDIFMVGNPQNDDCAMGNNSLTLSAADIDGILLSSDR